MNKNSKTGGTITINFCDFPISYFLKWGPGSCNLRISDKLLNSRFLFLLEFVPLQFIQYQSAFLWKKTICKVASVESFQCIFWIYVLRSFTVHLIKINFLYYKHTAIRDIFYLFEAKSKSSIFVIGCLRNSICFLHRYTSISSINCMWTKHTYTDVIIMHP